MTKTYIKILFIITLFFACIQFFIPEMYAGYLPIPVKSDVTSVSIRYNQSWDITSQINTIGFSFLRTLKVILQWVLLIFLVYIGAQMIMSMGSDEKELGAAKRQIRYALLGLLFINIPWTIYSVFNKSGAPDIIIDGNITNSAWKNPDVTNDNSLIADIFNLWNTLNDNIIWFLKVMIFWVAVFMFVYAWIRILTSQWREERVKESKEKIMYGVLALIFLGFIEAWKRLAFGGVITDGINIVQTLANLALFLAAPIALFFLTMAGYYYITSAGDEEKIKKAKRIIVTIVIATVILLASYSFLLDLSTLVA